MEESKEPTPAMSKARSINKLEESVINKIAAGEVVVRPSAALKELLENSIDAGSQNINVGWREGGLQMLQIQDDGHGIRVEDYPILCERFTTSKITKYQDLTKVASFGFRGEALASVSFVGKLEITSRTEDQDIAYKGYFENGNLVPGNGNSTSAPIAWAGHIGTLIKANDLFYNNKQRKKSFAKKEEFVNIVEVVMNYATHFCKVNFTWKALESNSIAVSTISISKENREENDVRKEVIRRLHGGVAEKDMFTVQHEYKSIGVKINALCTKANAKNTTKKNTLILFINNRLVKWDRIKKAIDSAYHSYLPKGHQYFVYLGLEMQPRDIDVNVHPTKKEVGFTNQDEIADSIAELIDKELSIQNTTIHYGNPDSVAKNALDSESKTEKRKSTKLSKSQKKIEKKNLDVSMEDDQDDDELYPTATQPQRVEQKSMVRTDHRDSTLDHFLVHGKLDSDIHKNKVPGLEYGINNPVVYIEKGNEQQSQELIDTPSKVMNLSTVIWCNLISIRKLIYEFEHDVDDDYTNMFKSHSYIGMINYDQVLVQYETCLLLVNVYPLLQEFVYQQTIYNFQNFGKFKFSTPLDIKDLLLAGLEYPECNYSERESKNKKDLAEEYMKKLNSIKEMLEDYFRITIQDNQLVSLPKIVKEIPAYIDYLPVLMVKLAADVDYQAEKNWFRDISQTLASYYAKFIYYYAINADEECSEDEGKIDNVEFILKNTIFPRLKKGLKVRSRFGTEGDTTFTTITWLENLYKVFERCS